MSTGEEDCSYFNYEDDWNVGDRLVDNWNNNTREENFDVDWFGDDYYGDESYGYDWNDDNSLGNDRNTWGRAN